MWKEERVWGTDRDVSLVQVSAATMTELSWMVSARMRTTLLVFSRHAAVDGFVLHLFLFSMYV